MLVTTKLRVDVKRPKTRDVVYAVQNDRNTRAVELSLLDGLEPWPIPTGTTAAIGFKKPDGTSGLYDTLPDGITPAVTIADSRIIAILAPQVLTQEGRVEIGIVLYDSQINQLGFFPIPVFVSKDLSGGQHPSNNYPDLTSATMVNATNFGLVRGVEGYSQNSKVLQNLIDRFGNYCSIFIPAGTYVFTEQINLGTKRSIYFVGSASGFPALLNRNTNLVPANVGTQIVFVGEPNTALFHHTNCFIDLEKLIFRNTVTQDGITVGALHQNYLFGYDNTEDNTQKGKIFARECGFYGWKCAIGYWYAGPEVDGDLPTGVKPQQCAILANRCRFSSNVIGVNNPLDSRLIDCSFNTNTYAIMHYQANTGYTTVSGCRLEWSKKNHVYENGTHDNTYIGCEFDRSLEAGVNINNSENLNISNCVFRRSGADEDLSASAYDRNVHLHINGCNNAHVENNTYVVKQITDNGGIKRPDNTIYMHGCVDSQCAKNDFTAGCTREYPHMGCRFENNKTTYVADNNGDHNHEYVMDYVADTYTPIPGFCKQIIRNTTPISLFGYNPVFSWKVGRLYKAGTVDETATSYAYSDCLILSSLLKRIALPENVAETQRVYFNADGTVNADETTAGEGTYCKIGIKYSSGGEIEQYLKQLYYGVQYADDATFEKVTPNGTVHPATEADVYDPDSFVSIPSYKPSFWSTAKGTITMRV